MRLLLFSDVHGNLTALEAVLEAARAYGPYDGAYCLGDLALFGPHPEACLERLAESGVQALAGNTDEWLAQDLEAPTPTARLHVAWCRARLSPEALAFLRGLPRALQAAELLMVHATPRTPHDDPRLCDPDLPPDEARAVFGEGLVAFGHRHGAFLAPSPGLVRVNVSSVSIPPEPRPLARFTVATRHDGHWSFAQHEVPYDPTPELQAARAHGLPPFPWWQALAG